MNVSLDLIPSSEAPVMKGGPDRVEIKREMMRSIRSIDKEHKHFLSKSESCQLFSGSICSVRPSGKGSQSVQKSLQACDPSFSDKKMGLSNYSIHQEKENICPASSSTKKTVDCQILFKNQKDSARANSTVSLGRDELESSRDYGRSVSFSHIEIRHHERELGDNPSCTGGVAPITLSWKPCSSTTCVSVDDYELRRPNRRKNSDLITPAFVRYEWVKDAGFSRQQINERIAEIKQVQKNRERTIKRLKFVQIEEAFESIGHKLRRLCRLRPHAKN